MQLDSENYFFGGVGGGGVGVGIFYGGIPQVLPPKNPASKKITRLITSLPAHKLWGFYLVTLSPSKFSANLNNDL